MISSKKISNVVVVIYILQQYPEKTVSYPKSPHSLQDISCHRIKCYEKCKKSLLNIDVNFCLPKKSAYFVETSCIGGLQSRFACSVEAVANTNPNWNILVIFAGPLRTEFRKSKTFSILNSIHNVYFYRLNTTKIAEGSPVEDIFSKNILSKSKFPVGHTSDFLKILLLYKFGGLYLDLDMIVMKSLDSLPKSFIAKQGPYDPASGIMAADRNGVGRFFFENSVKSLLDSLMTRLSCRDLAENFSLTSWGGNANDIFKRTLKNMCNTTNFSRMNADNCQGFHVLSHELFYPVHWRNWKDYYHPGAKLAPMDTAAYTHHVWNGYGAKVALQPNTVLVTLAKRYCPKIYRLYGDKFGH